MRVCSIGQSSLVALVALVALLAVGVLAACPQKAPTPTPSPTPPPAPTPTAIADAGPPPAREYVEPAGIGAVTIPKAPKGKGTWVVDPAETKVSFLIVSNSAGPIRGHFNGGAAGALDPTTKKGVFTIDLTTLETVDAKMQKNPVRDTNVVEAFFGARAFAADATRPAVDKAWEALTGKIKRGVKTATFVIDGVEGPAADPPRSGELVRGGVNGSLILWDSVSIPVSIAVGAQRKDDTIFVMGAGPATFNIAKVTGSTLRNALFETMLAAGCAHQPGIQNDVAVTFDRIVLKEQSK